MTELELDTSFTLRLQVFSYSPPGRIYGPSYPAGGAPDPGDCEFRALIGNVDVTDELSDHQHEHIVDFIAEELGPLCRSGSG